MFIILLLAIGLVHNGQGYEEAYPLMEADNNGYIDDYLDDSFELEKRNHDPYQFEKTHFEDYEDPRPTRGGKTLRNDYFIRFGRSKHQDFLRFGRSQKIHHLHKRETNPKMSKKSKQNFLRFGRNQHYLRFGRNDLTNRLRFEEEEEELLRKLREISESPIVRYLISVNANKCKN